MRSEIVRHGLVVVFLCLLTVVSLHAPWRFSESAPILDLGSDYEDSSGWFLSADGFSTRPLAGGDTIVLDGGASPAVPYVTVVKHNVPPVRYLEIAADIGVEGLSPGRELWQRAEVVMVSFDRSLKPIGYWPMKVMSIARDQEMRRISATFPVHPETAAVRLLLYNGAISGILSIRAVTVSPLTERSVFTGMRGLAVILWAAYLGFAVWRVFRLEGNRWMKGLFLALASFTAIGVLTPQPYYGVVVAHIERLADIVRYGLPPAPVHELRGSQSEQGPGQDESPEAPQESRHPPDRSGGTETDKPAPESNSPSLGGPLPIAEGAPDHSASLVNWILDRVTVKQAGHFSMFLLLAVAALVAFPGSSTGSVAVLLVLFAGASEVLQLFLATRSSSVFDFFLNLGGLALGMIFIWAARLTGRARRRFA